MNRPGLRFTVTRHNTLEDIEAFVPALAESIAWAKGHRASALQSETSNDPNCRLTSQL